LKIRCNKQKPACERCESSGVTCVYSPYRWKGRPSNSARVTSPTAATTPRESLASPYVPRGTGTRRDRQRVPEPLALPSSDDAIAAAMDMPFEDSIQGASVDLHVTPWEPRSPAPTQSSSGLGPSLESTGVLGNFSHHRDPGSSPSWLSMPTAELDALLSPANTPGPTHACIDMVLDIIRQLHHGSPESLRYQLGSSDLVHMLHTAEGLGDGCSMLSTDQALKVNRDALQSMTHILSQNCDYCAADPNMDLLLYTISSRVLSRYQTIFDCIAQRQPRHRSSSSSFSSSETLCFNPLQFGDFKVDIAASRRMNSQLLICELTSLVRFLDTLADHGKGISLRRDGPKNVMNNSAAATPKSLGYCLIEAFHQFLTTSANDLTLQIVRFCQT
jgi:hypothetical protein